MRTLTTHAAVILAVLFAVGSAQGIVLLEFNANDDTDPNDGWNYTGIVSGTLPVNTALSGTIERITDPGATQAYFSRSGDDRGFNGSLGNSVSVGDWSIETWIRKTETQGGLEDQVVIFRAQEFNTEFITVTGAGTATPHEQPDIVHQDFNGSGSRSSNINLFDWPDDEWQHWIITYQDSDAGLDNGILTIHVNDGTPIGVTDQKPRNIGASSFDEAGIFFFTSGDWNRGVTADIAVIRLHDKVLSPTEITASYRDFVVDLNIPEPGTLALLGLGALGIAGRGRRLS